MFIVLALATTSNLPSPQLSPLRCIFFPKLLIIPFFTTWIVSHCSHVSISTFNYQTIHCSSSLIATSEAKGQSIAITRIQLHVQSPNSHSCLFSKTYNLARSKVSLHLHNLITIFLSFPT